MGRPAGWTAPTVATLLAKRAREWAEAGKRPLCLGLTCNELVVLVKTAAGEALEPIPLEPIPDDVLERLAIGLLWRWVSSGYVKQCPRHVGHFTATWLPTPPIVSEELCDGR